MGATSCCRSLGTSTKRREGAGLKAALCTGKPKAALFPTTADHTSWTSKPVAEVGLVPLLSPRRYIGAMDGGRGSLLNVSEQGLLPYELLEGDRHRHWSIEHSHPHVGPHRHWRVTDRRQHRGDALHHQDGGHGHSHGLVDPSVKRSRGGLRAVSVSLAVLGVAAIAQTVVFVLSGSVALLADLI